MERLLQAQNFEGEKDNIISTAKATGRKIDTFREKIIEEMWQNYCLYIR